MILKDSLRSIWHSNYSVCCTFRNSHRNSFWVGFNIQSFYFWFNDNCNISLCFLTRLNPLFTWTISTIVIFSKSWYIKHTCFGQGTRQFSRRIIWSLTINSNRLRSVIWIHLIANTWNCCCCFIKNLTSIIYIDTSNTSYGSSILLTNRCCCPISFSIRYVRTLTAHCTSTWCVLILDINIDVLANCTFVDCIICCDSWRSCIDPTYPTQTHICKLSCYYCTCFAVCKGCFKFEVLYPIFNITCNNPFDNIVCSIIHKTIR